MKTKPHYTHVHPVYFDLQTGERSEKRISKSQTCFDSTSEFLCYKMISKYFNKSLFDIDVHNSLDFGSIKWRIDFQVTARREQPLANAVLAELVNTFHETQHSALTQIFIEYKGVQDDNFIKKMSSLATLTPMFSKTILLVSAENAAFGCYDASRKRFYIHPIISINVLENTLQDITGRLVNATR